MIVTSAQQDNERYLELLGQGKSLTENTDKLPEIRIAIVGDHATQQLTQVLKAAVARRGFFPRVYESDYSTAAHETFDRQSGLHGFKPEFVYFSIAVQK